MSDFIEVEKGSRAYEMLLAASYERWDEVRGYVESGENIHSGLTSESFGVSDWTNEH